MDNKIISQCLTEEEILKAIRDNSITTLKEAMKKNIKGRAWCCDKDTNGDFFKCEKENNFCSIDEIAMCIKMGKCNIDKS